MLFLTVILCGSSARGQDRSPGDSAAVAGVIKRFYAAYASGDAQAYRALLAADYRLLENGELMDAAGDLAMMPNPDSGYQRTDAFDFRSIKSEAGFAYAVYFLSSDIKDRKGSRHREWLESAILVRSPAGWLVSLLHSTRIAKQDR